MHLFTLFLATLPAPSRMPVQDTTPLAAGQRVRVMAPAVSPTPIVGAFARLAGDTLVVETPASAWRIPRGSVTRIDASRGMQSHTGQGALIGGVLGAGVTALALGNSSLCADLEAQGTCAAIGAGAGGLAGLLLGAAIGSYHKSERWERVPANALRVTLAPGGDRRLLLATSIAF
ncbi:MAG TPA: hypothetical protein VI139_00170 [Gemmatimonadales bacterium]